MATKKNKAATNVRDTRAVTPAPIEPVDKSRTIAGGIKEGETQDQAVARMVVRGTVGNASTVIDYSHTQFASLSLTDLARALKEQGDAVNTGDLASLERMLHGQAVALNAMFTELARRGALNMGEHLDATDRYIRLALKAQGQARATVETLAAIKNPPVVFARQANINNGGQQQVNNGTVPAPVLAAARAESPTIEQTELLGASDAQRLDLGAKGASGGADPHLEALGAINRPANR